MHSERHVNQSITNVRLGLLIALGLTIGLMSGCLDAPEKTEATACSEEEGGCPDGGQNVTSDRSRYPGYGTVSGSVIQPLTFLDGDGEDLSLSDVHADATRKVLLLTTSAGWCTACIEEQPKLQELHNEYHEAGLSIMVVLFEKQDYTPADARLARSWKSRYELDFMVVADPEFTMQPYYPNGDPAATPIMLIIDVDTMEILDTMVGFQEDTVRALITANL
jgi:thiol-disulfide isomerase/thioredoxin